MLLGILITSMLQPARARAFTPDAAVRVAMRAADALPQGAWDPAMDGAVQAAMSQRVAAEDADPESWLPLHRYAAPAAGDITLAGTLAADAPHAFAGAVASLSDAFASGDRNRWPQALERLAAYACDLADPYQNSALDLDEAPGGRARFGDLLAPESTPAVTARAESLAPGRALAEAVAMARGSAALRDTLERLAATGDSTAMDRLQHDRLDAATLLARRAVVAAWRATAALPDPGTMPLHVSPNPVRGHMTLTLSFVVPRSGAARFELFDLAGRRAVARDLGRLAAGAHVIDLDDVAGAERPGLYFARITTPAGIATARVVLATR